MIGLHPGRVAILSFESLCDRRVKSYFAEAARAGTLKVLTRKPVLSTREEIDVNPRSRSARLRAALRLS